MIHYCWFGGKAKPNSVQRCINSWRKHLPDYQIVEWNEANFDLKHPRYVREAYESKKWAFVSDYARLFILYVNGGIYMDTDVEVCRSLDRFLDHRAFTGFEGPERIPTGIIGAERQHPWIGELLSEYEARPFILDGGIMDLTTNVTTITNTALKRGLVVGGEYQVLDDDVRIYPVDWFCPLDYGTGKLKLTKNTHCIHHFHGSWVPLRDKFRRRGVIFLRNRFGENAVDFAVQCKRRIRSLIGGQDFSR